MKYFNGIPLIDENASHPQVKGKGYTARDYQAYPLGGHAAARVGAVAQIPESEWKDRIEEKTANKSWPSDLCERINLPVKDQQNSSYCWAHAPTRCMEAEYAANGGPKLVLAAFDAGACIKGGANQGGSGIEFLQWVSENGICTEALHKPMDFSSRRTTEQAANAALHKVVTFDDIDPSDRNSIVSSLLANRPVSVGIPSWGHEIAIVFLGWDNGVLFGGINSWGSSYGKNGLFWLTGSYTRFDEAGAPHFSTQAAT